MGETVETTVLNDNERDELAEPYAQLADELRFRVREDRPEDVRAWLRSEIHAIREAEYRRGVPFDIEEQWIALAMVQAAAQPDDARWLQLTDWRHGTYDDADDLDHVAIQRAVDGFRVRLTHAEQREVARRLAAKGLPNAVIADTLGISRHAVVKYVVDNRTPEQIELHEREVQRLLNDGLTLREVAERLGISRRSVTRHKDRLADTRSEAA